MLSETTSRVTPLVVTQDDVHSSQFVSQLRRDMAHRVDDALSLQVVELDCRGDPTGAELEHWWMTATILVRCLAGARSGGRLVLRHGSSHPRSDELAALAVELTEAWRDCGIEVVALAEAASTAASEGDGREVPMRSSAFATSRSSDAPRGRVRRAG